MIKRVILTSEEYELLTALREQAAGVLCDKGGTETLYVKIRRRRGQKRFVFYRRIKDRFGCAKEFYTPAEELPMHRHLVERYCAARVLKESEKLFNEGSSAGTDHVRRSIQGLFEELFGLFGSNTPKEYVPVRVTMCRWAANQPAPRYRVEELLRPTRRGDFVRSKFEELIADVLFEEGIPYRYEQKLQLGSEVVLPDFTLADPLTGRFTFVEALGMMENPAYAAANLRKLRQYEQAGYRLGEDLLLLFDSPSAPFDPELFRRQLRRKFRLSR